MVSRWKVIFAACVIFLAGTATGGMLIRTYAPRVEHRTHVTPPVQISTEHRMEYVNKLNRELQLTPDQRQKVEAIIAASQLRMKTLWDKIEPEVKEEYRCSRRDIFAVLAPEQRERMRQRWHHNGSRTNWGSWTNGSMAAPGANSLATTNTP